MSRTVRTVIFCAAAVVILGSALLLQYRSRPAQAEAYELVSQPFYPEFNDPLAVTALEVVDFDEEELKIRDFAVERNDNGNWVIPSHHGYPAEAQERLEKAAGSVIGVVREATQSRRKDDWSRLGVLSPTEFDDENLEGYGQKITFKDEDGEVLVDLIVGKPVPDQSGYYYVRRSDETATYIAKLNLDLSARFQDWIEPDLLGINSAFDLVKIGINKYSLNEQRRTIVPGEVLQLTRNKTTDPWVLEGIDEETEELNTGPISAFGNKVADLKIVGVRPKPPGVNPDLTLTPELLLNQQVLEIDMSRRGFLIAATEENEAPRLFSNEGEVSVGTKDGVEFTLYLGEVVSGSDRDIEIGAADDSSDDEPTDESTDTAGEDASEKGPRRYVLVTAEFNDALLGEKPVEPVAPVMPEELKAPADSSDNPESAKQENDTEAPATDSNADPSPEESPSEAESVDRPSNPDSPEGDRGTPEPSSESSEEPSGESPPAATSESEEPSCLDEETAADEESPTDESQDEAAEGQPETPDEESGTPAETSEVAPQENAAADESPESTTADENAPEGQEGEPEPPQIDPKVVMQAAYDEQVRQYEAAKRQYETDLAEYNRKVEEGTEKAKELSDRFAAWYYVITADSFEELNLTREDVVKSKVAATDDDNEGDSP